MVGFSSRYNTFMLLLTHVLIATTSMIFSGYTFLSPSKNRLKISYALIASALASGTYLVISLHANMVSACTSGLIYLAIVTFATIGARYRLEIRNQTIN
jgi:hypothetical protein